MTSLDTDSWPGFNNRYLSYWLNPKSNYTVMINAKIEILWLHLQAYFVLLAIVVVLWHHSWLWLLIISINWMLT